MLVPTRTETALFEEEKCQMVRSVEIPEQQTRVVGSLTLQLYSTNGKVQTCLFVRARVRLGTWESLKRY